MANINKINKGIWWIISQFFYKRNFYQIGKGSILFKPMQLDNINSISISDNVFVAEGAWLMGTKDYSTATLKICSGTVIGHFSHIVGLHDLCIEKNVLIADRVFISDCTHEYNKIDMPVGRQSIITSKAVIIGEDSWIGENVCICGASIGKHCVIGSNSVVTKDIPDYCVAAGIPAKVIKKYNFEKNSWDRI